MPIPAFGSIPDSAGNLNFKTFSDASSATALLQAQNAAAHANRVNVGAEQTLLAWGNKIVSTDPIEAISNMHLFTGRQSSGIAESIALAQQLMKGAQTTPPPTHE